jgi:hypothetical protein
MAAIVPGPGLLDCRQFPNGPQMKKATVSLLAAAAVLLLAFLLNPSPERHRQRIQEALGDRSPVVRALGLGALAAFASNYHSLGVASYTTINRKTVSIGVVGVVFVLSGALER